MNNDASSSVRPYSFGNGKVGSGVLSVKDFRTGERSGGPFPLPDRSGAGLLDTCEQLTRERPESGETDSELQKRERRRKQQRRVADAFRRVGMDRRADKMLSCGTEWWRASCVKCGTIQVLSVGNHCDDRFCPVCASRRSARLSDRYGRAISAFVAEKQAHAYFVTLTIKDVDELRPFSEYTKFRRLLFRAAFWKRYGLIGGVSAFELKIGKGSGKWHPHFHTVIFTKRAVECIEIGRHAGEFQNTVNQEVSDLWLSLTGNSFVVKGKRFDGNVRELLKYIVKGASNMADVKLAELAKWSKGKRFVSTFGACYNNPLFRQAAVDADDERPGKLHRCECGGCEFSVDVMREWNDSDRFVVDEVRRVVLSDDTT